MLLLSEPEELIEMAREEFEQGRIMYEAGVTERKLWSSLYYSMFYAANAGLFALGYDPTSHRGTNMLVGRELYKEHGVIEKRTASFYSEMRRHREDLDYSPHAALPERELGEARNLAEAFIDAMERIVSNSSTG